MVESLYQRLVSISYGQIILQLVVIFNINLLSISHGKLRVFCFCTKVYTLYRIGPFITVIGNETWTNKLLDTNLLIVLRMRLPYFIKSLQNSFCAHESEAVIYYQCALVFILITRSLVTLPNLYSKLCVIYWVWWIKKSWSVSKLN